MVNRPLTGLKAQLVSRASCSQSSDRLRLQAVTGHRLSRGAATAVHCTTGIVSRRPSSANCIRRPDALSS
jgi:hypothetical protein